MLECRCKRTCRLLSRFTASIKETMEIHDTTYRAATYSTLLWSPRLLRGHASTECTS